MGHLKDLSQELLSNILYKVDLDLIGFPPRLESGWPLVNWQWFLIFEEMFYKNINYFDGSSQLKAIRESPFDVGQFVRAITFIEVCMSPAFFTTGPMSDPLFQTLSKTPNVTELYFNMPYATLMDWNYLCIILSTCNKWEKLDSLKPGESFSQYTPPEPFYQFAYMLRNQLTIHSINMSLIKNKQCIQQLYNFPKLISLVMDSSILNNVCCFDEFVQLAPEHVVTYSIKQGTTTSSLFRPYKMIQGKKQQINKIQDTDITYPHVKKISINLHNVWTEDDLRFFMIRFPNLDTLALFSKGFMTLDFQDDLDEDFLKMFYHYLHRIPEYIFQIANPHYEPEFLENFARTCSIARPDDYYLLLINMVDVEELYGGIPVPHVADKFVDLSRKEIDGKGVTQLRVDYACYEEFYEENEPEIIRPNELFDLNLVQEVRLQLYTENELSEETAVYYYLEGLVFGTCLTNLHKLVITFGDMSKDMTEIRAPHPPPNLKNVQFNKMWISMLQLSGTTTCFPHLEFMTLNNCIFTDKKHALDISMARSSIDNFIIRHPFVPCEQNDLKPWMIKSTVYISICSVDPDITKYYECNQNKNPKQIDHATFDKHASNDQQFTVFKIKCRSIGTFEFKSEKKMSRYETWDENTKHDIKINFNE